VNEDDWLRSTDPQAIVRFLLQRSPPPDPRKLRLFACACARRLWPQVKHTRWREIVLTAERFADGRVGRRQLEQAHRGARWISQAAYNNWLANPGKDSNGVSVGYIIVALTERDPGDAALSAARSAVSIKGSAESAVQSALVRDLFGNPFRPPPAPAAWLGHPDETVLRLARVLYDEGRFADLPVLGDALEDAGCTDEQVLGHCRSSGPHVRGCWLLDAVLGKTGEPGA
jgi:hypothetical protein